MREPDFELDGWCLEDGENLHRAAPKTFWIPELERRQSLEPGDFAKLVFQISLDSDEEPVAVERMWVLVRQRVGNDYFGLLDNDPFCLEENDVLWSGVELPFSSRHVIDIDPADETSRAKAAEPSTQVWPRH
jgi:hypothetical protein